MLGRKKSHLTGGLLWFCSLREALRRCSFGSGGACSPHQGRAKEACRRSCLPCRARIGPSSVRQTTPKRWQHQWRHRRNASRPHPPRFLQAHDRHRFQRPGLKKCRRWINLERLRLGLALDCLNYVLGLKNCGHAFLLSRIPHANPPRCQLRHGLGSGRFRPNGPRSTLLIARFCPGQPNGRWRAVSPKQQRQTLWPDLPGS